MDCFEKSVKLLKIKIIATNEKEKNGHSWKVITIDRPNDFSQELYKNNKKNMKPIQGDTKENLSFIHHIRHKKIIFLQRSRIGDWRRKWQLTPVPLPGEFHGQRNCSPRGAAVHHSAKSQTWLSGLRRVEHTRLSISVVHWSKSLFFLKYSKAYSTLVGNESLSYVHFKAQPGGDSAICKISLVTSSSPEKDTACCKLHLQDSFILSLPVFAFWSLSSISATFAILFLTIANLLLVSMSLFVCLDSTYQRDHTAFVLCLTYFT